MIGSWGSDAQRENTEELTGNVMLGGEAWLEDLGHWGVRSGRVYLSSSTFDFSLLPACLTMNNSPLSYPSVMSGSHGLEPLQIASQNKPFLL